MGIASGYRIINQIVAGTLTGSALETYLTTGANYASFRQAIGMRSGARMVAESPTAVTAVSLSSKACTAVTETSVALQALLLDAEATTTMVTVPAFVSACNSSQSNSLTLASVVTATPAALSALSTSSGSMTALAAGSNLMSVFAASTFLMTAFSTQSVAMNALAANTVSKMAIYNSDTALNALAGVAQALTSMRAAAGYSVKTTGATSPSSTARSLSPSITSGNWIMLGMSRNFSPTASGTMGISAGRRAGSTRSISEAATAVSSTAATDVAFMTPLDGSLTPTTIQSNTDLTEHYIGLLRCDV